MISYIVTLSHLRDFLAETILRKKVIAQSKNKKDQGKKFVYRKFQTLFINSIKQNFIYSLAMYRIE